MFAVRLNATTYPIEAVEQAELERAGAELVTIEGKRPEEIIAAARDCDALVVVSSKVPAQVIDQLSQCRVIARLGAGTDNIDVAAATRSGIVVTNVPDFCLNEQAEHAFALLLAWARRLPSMFQAMHEGLWTARHNPDVHRLAGQTLGLVGFGQSAQGVARRAAAFDMKILATVRSPAKYADAGRPWNVQFVDLDELLRAADFVSLHLPLTSETRHLIDAQKLNCMKSSAVLINTARGAIVDEPALVKALRARRIGGAALDVFEGIDVFAMPSAPPPHPLFELDNVLMTPHCAGSSVESSRESKVRGVRNAAFVLRGEWPPHVVNQGVTPRFPLRQPSPQP